MMQPKHSDLRRYQFIAELIQLPFVDHLWLYGSRARGDAGERSDIDLAIDCPNASDSNWQQILDIVAQADTLLAIDCVRFDQLPINSALRANIIRDRVLFYERKRP